MCARYIMYIRTSLRTLQAGIYNNSHLIKNLFRLQKKNLGSFMWVSTVYKIKGTGGTGQLPPSP